MGGGVMVTKAEALENAGRIFTRGLLRVLSSDPREAAERAYMKNVTPPVDVLEARIREMQTERASARSAAA